MNYKKGDILKELINDKFYTVFSVRPTGVFLSSGEDTHLPFYASFDELELLYTVIRYKEENTLLTNFKEYYLNGL